MKKSLHLIALLVGLIFAASSCSKDDAPLEYDYIAVKLVDSESWSILDTQTGELLYKDEFKQVPSAIYNGVFVIKNENGTFDYYNVDDVKKPINKEPYYAAMDFAGTDRTFATKPGGKITIINTDCKELVELDEDITVVTHLQDGYAFYGDASDKVGLIDDNGKIIVKAKYDNTVGSINDGVAIFIKNNEGKDTKTYYAVSTSGEELFSLKSDVYSNVGTFCEGKLPVVKGDEIIMLDKEGKKLYKLCDIDEDNEWVVRWITTNEGKTIFKDGSSYGLKDGEGETLIRAKYDDLTHSYDDRYVAERDDKYGVINAADETIIDFKYKHLLGIRPDRYLAKSGNTYTLIDDKGEDATTKNFEIFSLNTCDYIRTNYIDPKAYAENIVKTFTDESCCGYNGKTTVADLQGTQLTNSEYSYADEYSATINYANNANKSCVAFFDDPIASQQYTYETFYGYTFRQPNGYAFNGSTAMRGVYVEFDITEFPAVEDKVAAEFDRLIKKKGYTALSKDGHLYRSPKGTVVGLGYSNGKLQLWYYFKESNYIAIPREKRSRAGQEDGDTILPDLSNLDEVEADTLETGTVAGEADTVAGEADTATELINIDAL